MSFLIEFTVSTAAGLCKKVYWDLPSGLRGKKLAVARRMHNPQLRDDLDLPAKGLKFRVNDSEGAGPNGHVRVSIEEGSGSAFSVGGDGHRSRHLGHAQRASSSGP